MRTFDEDGNLTLTKAEIDLVLERFDQTDPPLQRNIVAGFAGMLLDAKWLLADIQREVGNRAPEVRQKYLPASIRDRIDRFLN